MDNTNNTLLTGNGSGLFTDLYELTMSQALFKQGMLAPAVFSLAIRRYPPGRGYFVAAGLQDVLDHLADFHFDPASLDYLRSTGIFADDFLEYLSGLRFTGSVRAIPEGRVFFCDEPPIEITAPVIEGQIVETFVLNQISVQTLLATKASRCVWAARGRVLTDFASRRTQGVDAALKMARSSYIAGFASTSNMLAARKYGIPATGTMAHSFISCFQEETEAFRAYASTFPDRTVLLLDTYDTIAGARRAALVGKELEDAGHRLGAVRLDSGDFDSLSREVRKILDSAGLHYVKVLASGGLDEYELDRLARKRAPIDIFGVGTKAGVSEDAPSLDIAYKLVSYDGRPVMKLSTDKESLPGPKQVFRFLDSNGNFSGDTISLQDESFAGGTPLLMQVMKEGMLVGPHPELREIRERFSRDFESLDDRFKALVDPPHYPVAISGQLGALVEQVKKGILANYPQSRP